MPTHYYELTEEDSELSASGLSKKTILGIVGAGIYFIGCATTVWGLCNKPWSRTEYCLFDNGKFVTKSANPNALESAMLNADNPSFEVIEQSYGNKAIFTGACSAGVPMIFAGLGLIGAWAFSE